MSDDKPSRHTSRKFLLAVGCTVIATGLLLGTLITGDHWVDAMKWVTGLYMAGNVGEKFTNKDKEFKP